MCQENENFTEGKVLRIRLTLNNVQHLLYLLEYINNVHHICVHTTIFFLSLFLLRVSLSPWLLLLHVLDFNHPLYSNRRNAQIISGSKFEKKWLRRNCNKERYHLDVDRISRFMACIMLIFQSKRSPSNLNKFVSYLGNE